jgi:hypothetical protein
MKSKIFLVSLIFDFLFLGTVASAQMMGRGHSDGSMCPGATGQAGLMRDPDVKMVVTETADGVSIGWSSKNPEKAKALKEMAQRMKTMHSQQLEVQPSK